MVNKAIDAGTTMDVRVKMMLTSSYGLIEVLWLFAAGAWEAF